MREMPHVVIWAHAANDVQERDIDRVYQEHIPGYIHAANKLRMCDEHLPLVVMVEEFHGVSPGAKNVSHLSPMIHNVSERFGLMDISHANVIRGKVIENLDKPSIVNSITAGEGKSVHPAMVRVCIFIDLREIYGEALLSNQIQTCSFNITYSK